jgi:DNA-directed RNA polymerase specialized sigma24 family protein
MEDATKSTWIVAALDQYEGQLVRYAAWILGDVERAREVVQETFLRLCKEQPARIESHLAQWLFTVCRNLAFDVRKKENRMSPLKDPETLPITYDRPGASLEHEITKLSVTNVGFLIHTAIKTLRKELLAESAKRRIQ